MTHLASAASRSSSPRCTKPRSGCHKTEPFEDVGAVVRCFLASRECSVPSSDMVVPRTDGLRGEPGKREASSGTKLNVCELERGTRAKGEDTRALVAALPLPDAEMPVAEERAGLEGSKTSSMERFKAELDAELGRGALPAGELARELPANGNRAWPAAARGMPGDPRRRIELPVDEVGPTEDDRGKNGDRDCSPYEAAEAAVAWPKTCAERDGDVVSPKLKVEIELASRSLFGEGLRRRSRELEACERAGLVPRDVLDRAEGRC